MAKTHFTKALRISATMTILSGLMLSSVYAYSFAEVTGLGTTVPQQVISTITGAEYKPAAMSSPVNVYDKAGAAVQVSLGMLLVIAGLFLHLAARLREERPVHITVAPKKKELTMFWVEMNV